MWKQQSVITTYEFYPFGTMKTAHYRCLISAFQAWLVICIDVIMIPRCQKKKKSVFIFHELWQIKEWLLFYSREEGILSFTHCKLNGEERYCHVHLFSGKGDCIFIFLTYFCAKCFCWYASTMKLSTFIFQQNSSLSECSGYCWPCERSPYWPRLRKCLFVSY